MVVSIQPGATRDFSSVQVDAGGVLELAAGAAAWTFIGVAGDMIVNGEIRARGNGDFLPGPQLINGAAPDDGGLPGLGEQVSYALGQGKGGMGGVCANPVDRIPGKTAFGNGGGGIGFCYFAYGSWLFDQTGAATFGKDATSSAGGLGGDGSTTFSASFVAGVGGVLYGVNGDDGVTIGCGQYGCGSGPGGGGGSRGQHGQGLYFRVKGSVAGNGTIDASGQPGGNGGAGDKGACNSQNSCATAVTGGSGGGGGAGGSGGKIVIRYHNQISPALKILTKGGKGGLGGKAGSGGTSSYPGGSGLQGDDGTDQSIDPDAIKKI